VAHPTEATDAEIEEFLATPADPGSPMAKIQHAYKSERGRRIAQQRLLAQLNEAPPEPAPVQFHVPEVPNGPLIDDEERESFGDELSSFIERTALRAAQRITTSEIKKVVEPLNARGEADAQRRLATMKTMLDRSLNDAGANFTFAQLNEHPDFLAWLNLKDAISGATRLSLLRHAWNSLDGSRVLAVVGAFLDETFGPPQAAVPAAQTPPAPQSAAPQPAPVPLTTPRAPQIDILSLAAPGRAPITAPAAAQLPPPDPSRPVYTRKSIADFYRFKAQNRYTPEQALAIEQDIFMAQNEGRIVG
jgi:hypothetical protein